MGGEERKRMIKLFCPSMSKIVQLVAWEEQRLDLGSIARAFGLDPRTVKLNGHFISRGVDLIAFSVTWRSLISFFSSRGLSTGSTDSDALIVDGKLSKLGSKRLHDPADQVNGIHVAAQLGTSCPNEKLLLGDVDWARNKKLKGSNAGLNDGKTQATGLSCLSFKRKSSFEDPSLWKRLKTQSSDSGFQEKKDDLSKACSHRLSCGCASEDMKRLGEADLVVTASCKRIRL